MTYQEFIELKNRMMDKCLPSIEVQMCVDQKVKSIFSDYGKDIISEAKALNRLKIALHDWKDAEMAIDAIHDELNRLPEQVEL